VDGEKDLFGRGHTVVALTGFADSHSSCHCAYKRRFPRVSHYADSVTMGSDGVNSGFWAVGWGRFGSVYTEL
jgi:hypothetical protein